MPKELAVGIDIGSTRTRLGLCDRPGNLFERRELPTPPEPQVLLVKLNQELRACCTAQGVKWQDLLGVGCALAGTVDTSRGVVGRAPNLPHWQGFSLLNELKRVLALPVVVDNDANAAAWGIARFEAPELKHLIYVTISTGIGGGIVIDKKIHRGRSGNAGEVGHMILQSEGPLCQCGKRGCWEALSSGTAIARRARERLHLQNASAEEVFKRAAQGERASQKIVEEAAFYLGIGLANLSEIFDPEAIFLGGGVMQSWNQLQEKTLQAFREYSRWETPIRLTRLGDDVGLLGAAALVL